MIYFCGNPDDDFDGYVTKMFAHVDHLSFDSDGIIKLQKRIFSIFSSNNFRENYIFLDHSGICEVINKEKSFINSHIFENGRQLNIPLGNVLLSVLTREE